MGLMQKIIKSILSPLLIPFRPLIKPILKLVDSMDSLSEVLAAIISQLPKFLELIAMLADPSKLIKDVVFGLKTGTYLIYNSILDLFFGNLSNSFKHSLENNNNNNNNNNDKKEECVKPTFLEILILVLCPPLAIFIRKGLKSFLTILITSILTYFYYLPGVLFASLHIL